MVRRMTVKIGTNSSESVLLDERYRYDVVGNKIRIKRQGQKWEMMRVWKVNNLIRRSITLIYLEM